MSTCHHYTIWLKLLTLEISNMTKAYPNLDWTEFMITKIFSKAIKPFQIISLLTTYFLGGGLVQYLRGFRGFGTFLQGGLFLLFVLIGFELLRLNQSLRDARNWPEGILFNEVKRTRWVIALIAATLMTVGLTIVIDWMVRDVIWQGLVFLVFGFLAACAAYFLTEYKKSLQPFEILIEVFLFVVIPPAFAFFIQSDEPHRLLTMVVIGLMPAFIAYRLLIQLKSYRQDQRSGKRTFVTYVGWQKAMTVHNALVLLSYLLYAFVTLIGFPWFLIWPVFLTLPIGLVEIWLMERVRRGSKPLWTLMQIATGSVFFMPMYLLGFAFWIR